MGNHLRNGLQPFSFGYLLQVLLFKFCYQSCFCLNLQSGIPIENYFSLIQWIILWQLTVLGFPELREASRPFLWLFVGLPSRNVPDVISTVMCFPLCTVLCLQLQSNTWLKQRTERYPDVHGARPHVGTEFGAERNLAKPTQLDGPGFIKRRMIMPGRRPKASACIWTPPFSPKWTQVLGYHHTLGQPVPKIIEFNG